MKFEKQYARCTDLAAQLQGIFYVFSRRLRENERTLVTLTLRIDEAFPNEIEVISEQSFRTAPYFIMHTVPC